MLQTINKRRISYERMAQIYRAMNQEHMISDSPVTFQDIEGLVPGYTFGQFIRLNRDAVQLFEEVEHGA